MTAIMNIVLVALSMGSCVVNGQLLRTTTRTYGDTVHLTVDVDHWNLGYVDKASWTLPNGQTLQAGQSSSGFTASGSMYIGGRTSRYTLTVDAEAAVDGNIVFNVESAGQYMRPGWKATGTFKITKTKRKTPPKLTGKMSMTHHMSSYGQYQIEAVAEVTVHGGDPVPDKYEWRLPYGNTIMPGQKSGNYDAQYPTTNSDGSKTYKLNITNNAQRSYIRFTVSSSTAPYSTYATFGSGKK